MSINTMSCFFAKGRQQSSIFEGHTTARLEKSTSLILDQPVESVRSLHAFFTTSRKCTTVSTDTRECDHEEMDVAQRGRSFARQPTDSRCWHQRLLLRPSDPKPSLSSRFGVQVSGPSIQEPTGTLPQTKKRKSTRKPDRDTSRENTRKKTTLSRFVFPFSHAPRKVSGHAWIAAITLA